VSTLTVIAALLIAVPAVGFAAWPLVSRREGHGGFLPLPSDAREQLYERKRTALRALRELEFEHGAGHLSDADYADLRARYEAEAAAVLTELDRLGADVEHAPVARRREATATGAPTPTRSAWRHPLVLGGSAVAVLAFGIAIGVSLVQHTEPDRGVAMSAPGAAPAAPMVPPQPGDLPGGSGMAPMAGAAETPGGPARPITPEVMQAMLQAARGSLFEGRYNDAILAYQAILKRDPKNVDALTHLGLIVAIGGHADSALDTFDRALSLDPNYAPALLYRGQVLFEVKKDAPGAIKAWEKFLKVTPPGEDHDRVAKMMEQARAQQGAPAK
jgi:tetratricopeptide (TPR) repeat protein